MEKVTVAAFELKSNEELTDRHFEDSLYLDLYEIWNNGFVKIKRVENVRETEIPVAFNTGSNIVRIRF